ncbi:MAG: prephenate dehydratase [Calditrichia bacterium]
MKIGIQGGPLSYHEFAMNQYFGSGKKEIDYYSTFNALIRDLSQKKMDYAVIAIENTVAGSILQNYGLIERYQVWITGEIYYHISLHLMALDMTPIEQLEKVLSHPMALNQAHEFLNRFPKLELVEWNDTADAAKYVKEHNIAKTGVIAARQVADYYGLHILAEDIQTHSLNFTRFLILSSDRRKPDSGANKATISFQLVSKVGALADVLQVFKKNNINLTKIQSIPIPGKPSEYSFHVDLVWEERKNYVYAIEELTAMVKKLVIFGEYNAAPIPFSS